MPAIKMAVIPAQAGIQVVHLIDFQNNQPYELDSRLRGNDGEFFSPLQLIHNL